MHSKSKFACAYNRDFSTSTSSLTFILSIATFTSARKRFFDFERAVFRKQPSFFFVHDTSHDTGIILYVIEYVMNLFSNEQTAGIAIANGWNSNGQEGGCKTFELFYWLSQ